MPNRNRKKSRKVKGQTGGAFTQAQLDQLGRILSKRIVKVEEEKYVDLNIGTAVTVTTTPTITPINVMIPGNSVNTRIGNQLRVTRLEMRAVTVVGDATQLLRLILIWDKQPNGVLATEANIFALAGQPLSQRNNDNIKRFDFLYDAMWVEDTNDSVKDTRVAKLNINRRAFYIGNGGAIANIATGALLLYQISDSGAAPHPTQGVAIRMYYVDA